MATAAAVPEAPLNILPAEDPPERPKRKYRKRRRARKLRRAPVLKPAPQSPSGSLSTPATVESGEGTATAAGSSSTLSEGRSADFLAATAAVPERIGEPEGAPAAPGVLPAGELAQPAAPEHDFNAWAELYLPKVFDWLALALGEHWKLKPLERKLLVPECAGSIEELWPVIQK